MKISQDARDKLEEISKFFQRESTDKNYFPSVQCAYSNCAALLRDFLSAATVDGWQDISTAPRDYTDMILFVPWISAADEEDEDQQERVTWGNYNMQRKCFVDANDGYAVVHPSHWRPLPAPPTTKEVLG